MVEKNSRYYASDDVRTLMEFLSIPLWDSASVLARFADLSGSISRGEGPKSFVYIPGEREDRVVLVAHADTVWDSCMGYRGYQWPAPVISDGWIHPTGSAPGLGADDRAGCAILWQLRYSGHSILVVNGEESGCRGSQFLMDHNPDIADQINQHQFMVEFDRRNGRDFKCYGVGTPEFRQYLKAETGYTEPDRDSFTDIGVLCREICGVNLSVGFREEHGWFERLCTREWRNTLELCREWLLGNRLPRFTSPPRRSTRYREEWYVDSYDFWLL